MKHLSYFILAVLIVYLIGSLLLADFLWILHTGFLGWIGAIFIILWFFLQIEKEFGDWNIEEEEIDSWNEENKGLSNQLDAMVSQCQRMNAGKLRMSFKREDGYTIDVTARQTEAKFDDEFSNKELKYIKETMIEKISSVSNKEAAEKAKKDLSGMVQTQISLPFISAGPAGPLHLEATLTRAQFNEMTKGLVERTLVPVRQALKDAGLTANDIHQVLLVGGSTRIPAVQEAIKNELGKEPNKSVNPDECVSLGAAIQGGVIAGDVKDVLLLDVTPLSLGIETMGGVMTVLIPRNTTIPTSKSQIFSTAADNQPAVDIHVLQGERPMAQDNKTLGNFQLDGIAPARRGVPQIEVTFDIDVNGIVHVTAVDKATSKKQSITITNSSGLSEDEIDRMVKEAEAHKAEDDKRKEEIETKNRAEAFIHQIDETLQNENANVTEEQKAEVKKLRDELQEAIDKNDTEGLKTKLDALEKAANDMAQAMYQSQAGQQAAGDTAGNSTSANDDVVDADFQEKK